MLNWALSVGACSSILEEFLRSFVVNTEPWINHDYNELQFAVTVHPSFILCQI